MAKTKTKLRKDIVRFNATIDKVNTFIAKKQNHSPQDKTSCLNNNSIDVIPADTQRKEINKEKKNKAFLDTFKFGM